MSVSLDREVDSALLQRALDNVMKRFPSFRYSVRRGLFWWFLCRLENNPVVCQPGPLKSIDVKSNGGYMFKLACQERRLDLDVYHALTDGTGAMTFLLSVCAEYLKLGGANAIEYGKWIYNPDDEPEARELEDGFDRFSGAKGSLDQEESAWHIKGKEEKADILNSLGLSVQLDQVVAKAREMDCTLTEFVTALMLYSLQEVRAKEAGKKKSPFIRMEVPVNLRPIFGSPTLRNFSSYVYITLDVSNCEYSLEEVVKEVKLQKRLYVQPARLTRRIAANVALEDNLAIRCIPLFIKKRVINIINHLKGDKYATYTFSNLGNIEVPEGMASYLDDIHFILGRTRKRSGSCACVSYGGRLNLDFSRKIQEDDFERIFARNLRSLGIWSEIQVPSEPLRPVKPQDKVIRPVFRRASLFPKFLLSF
ncbi:MAG: hypothetical protein IKH11_01330 [Bacteroidales bacterium]|nr:hypothetical protein [Bacteroidales bacterium]